MRLRPYTRQDVADMTTIHASCNKTDAIVRHIYTNVDKYPTSYRLGIWRFIRSTTLSPGAVTLVVETEPSDYPASESHKAPEVIGFAKYDRHGISDQAKNWQGSNSEWATKVERFLISLEDRYYRAFPSAQPTYRLANFIEIRPTLLAGWDQEIFSESWELSLLFVRPDWQKKGVGKRLMKWGFERSQEDRVPLLVKSSPLGGAAYRASGFKVLNDIPFEQFFNVVEYGGEGCKAWVWEPELEGSDGIEGGWHERAIRKATEASKINTTVMSV